MPSLERFTLRLRLDPARDYRLRDIEWPARLTHLTVCINAHLEGVAIPPSISVIHRKGFPR